jgi:hypothetical protein
MSPLAWCVVIGIMLGIELYLAWRVATALSRGSVVIDPLFWVADWLGLEFVINRAANPLLYWLGILFLMLLFVVVLALFMTVSVINLRTA